MADPSNGDSDEALKLRIEELRRNEALVREDAVRLRRDSQSAQQRFVSTRTTFVQSERAARQVSLNLMEDLEEARTARLREEEERQRADKARRISEAKYRSLFDTIDEGFCIIEILFDAHDRAIDYRFVEVNPAFARQTGVVDPVGRCASETAPGHEPFWAETYGQVARTGESVRFESYAAGFDRWYSVYAFRTGEVSQRQVAVVFDDITKRKQSEKKLAMAEEQLRLIVDSALEHAIVSVDRERRIVSWNPGAERMFGYRAPEVAGQSLDLIFTPEDRAAEKPEQETATALAEGRALGESWLIRRDGTLFWGNCAMLPMTPEPEGKPVGFVKIMRDETAALEARKTLEQSSVFLRDALRDTEAARAEAEAANRAKDRFLAVLSHELRTPLTPVLMAVHMLNRQRGLNEMARESLGMIGRNVQLEVNLIDDLLDLTRVERGKLEIAREACDLHETIRRAVEVVQPDIDGKGQRLTVALEAPEFRLSGDARRLQQVFWNLLKNASKFTPEGGEISLRSRAGEETPGGVEVAVSDTGIGMEPGVVERIFDPFEQADASITKLFGGLGLGLAISKAVVEAHGGGLRATSPGRGKGAVFMVSLPL